MNLYVELKEISCNHCLQTIEAKLIKKIISLGYYTEEDYISDDIIKLDNKTNLKEIILIITTLILIFYLLYKLVDFNIFNIIPTIDSNITYGMFFITGLFTSIHCISMCGAINLLTVINKTGKRNYKRPILYNLGRLISYTFLGAVVGLIGSTITINNKVSGIIILLAATIMFLMALSMLGVIPLRKVKISKGKLKTKSPFLIGLLNGLMPCGPL